MRCRAVILGAVAVLAAVGGVLAQSSASFRLPWDVIAGGGALSASAQYQVAGTVGQGAASPPVAESASYRVGSGYWAGIRGLVGAPEPTPIPPPDREHIYLPLIRRGSP